MDPKEIQEMAFHGLSDRVIATSTQFDLDSAGQKTKFDDLIKQMTVAKSLESDDLYFFEGMTPDAPNGFIGIQDYHNHLRDRENWETVSAGDFNEAFE